MKPLILSLAAAVATFLLSSCVYTAPTTVTQQPYLAGYEIPKPLQEQGYWDGDGILGKAKIRIKLAEQKAYFYKGSQLVGQTPISSGTASHRTPKGSYKVTQKSKDHKSSLYGVIKDNATGAIINKDADTRKHRAKAGQTFVNAPMANFLRFNGAIGMHTGHLPGYPASHGCVRLPNHMAEKFFEHASYGTPVIVE